MLMAEMIDNVEVKLGRAIRVKNLDPQHGEAEVYVALQVEDLNGKNERCVLFTEHVFYYAYVVTSSVPFFLFFLDFYSNNKY